MLIEFASPPSDFTEFVDAFHEGEEARFRRLDDIVDGTGPSGLAGRLLNDQELLLISAEEPPTFALAERDRNWRRAMLEEMKAIEEKRDMAARRSTSRMPSDQPEVGVQGQAGRARRHCQAQGAPRHLRLCSARGHRL